MATAKTTLCFDIKFFESQVAKDGEHGEKRGVSGECGESPYLESSKIFCDNWGGFSFVSQNMHNTKVLGIGGYVFLWITLSQNMCIWCARYINGHPINKGAKVRCWMDERRAGM